MPNSEELHNLTGAWLAGKVVQHWNNATSKWVDETAEPVWFDGRSRRIKPSETQHVSGAGPARMTMGEIQDKWADRWQLQD